MSALSLEIFAFTVIYGIKWFFFFFFFFGGGGGGGGTKVIMHTFNY